MMRLATSTIIIISAPTPGVPLLLFDPLRPGQRTRRGIFGGPIARPVQKALQLTSFSSGEVGQYLVLGLRDGRFRPLEQRPALAGELSGQRAA